MNEEIIIRKEASDFFRDRIAHISSSPNAIDNFHMLKHRLDDFYSSVSKAIFLDEIEILITGSLQKHREQAHKGQRDPNCTHEIKAEKLLFYIKQEIDTLPIIARQKYKTDSKNVRTKVFVSYSHLDKKFLNDIQRHFKPFYNKIDYWDDSKILPGQKWQEEIENAISETKVAILLVSTEFLGSQFITENELPLLLNAAEKEGAVILIVILKPCLFENFDRLNKYQTLNPPTHPVITMSEEDREYLFVNLVRQTKRILEH